MLASLVLLSVGVAQSIDCSPYLAKADPTTRLAIELSVERVELAEMETLFQRAHPAIARQRRHVRKLERTLGAMKRAGHAINHTQIDVVLDRMLQEAQSELISARQVLRPAHPRLALLELRLQSIGQIVARRALAG